jgi:hypothetical protein
MSSPTWTNRFDKNCKDVKGNPVTVSEWYDTCDQSDHYRDRFTKALNRLRFKSGIWLKAQEVGIKNIGDKHLNGWDRVYHFLNDVRKLAGYPEMTREFFNEGIEYRDIFSPNYKYALEEMWLLCWGDW